VHDRVPFAEVRAAAEFMVKQYLEGAIDTIEVIFPRFKNTLVQESIVRPVLPLHTLKEFIESLADESAPARAALNDSREILFEPDVTSVLNALLPYYVNRHIYQLVLSAKASEHSARMVAMKTAKDNATKILGELTLEYNKARQAAITQEILEIAAAAFSST
jgi:F-type H+-transporting ATPase subunit gamma